MRRRTSFPKYLVAAAAAEALWIALNGVTDMNRLALAAGNRTRAPKITYQTSFKGDFELGTQDAVRTRDSKWTRTRVYMYGKGEYTVESSTGTSMVLEGAARVWNPDERPAGYKERNRIDDVAEIRALSGTWNPNPMKIQAGFQEIPWGETFGFFVADLVNPRDLTDPLITELGWTRLPVFALNGQVFIDKLTLQAVVTPVPRNNKLPRAGSAFDPFKDAAPGVPVRTPSDFAIDRFGRDMEFGGKASYLFDFGLDAGLLYYRHWNRNPVYQLRNAPDGLAIVPVIRRTDSIGMTASQSWDSFVFRADSVLHLDEPQMSENLAPSKIRNHWQTIVGSDYTTEGGWTFGLQHHTDYVNNITRDYLFWMSGRVSTKFFSEALETDFFIFRGLNNRDFWMQPKLTWNVNGNISASVRADFLSSKGGLTQTALGSLGTEDRLMTWITLRL